MSATPPSPDPDEPVGQRIAAGLAKIGLALRHRAWQEGFARDLTPTQGQILVFLEQHPGAGLGDVSRQLAIRAPTASDAVTALVGKGLVERSRDPADRRRLSLSLTAAGRKEAGQAAMWPDFLADSAEELSPEEQAVFVRSLQTLIRGLQKQGQVPLARMCSTCRYFRPRVHEGEAHPHHCAYVDLPLADSDLRIDCPDHDPEEPAVADQRWRHLAGRPATSG